MHPDYWNASNLKTGEKLKRTIRSEKKQQCDQLMNMLMNV